MTDPARFPHPADIPAVRAWNAAHRPELAAVRQWAAPLLAAARQIGPTPPLGTLAWQALPTRDPRKLAAAVAAAVEQVADTSPTAIAERLRTELDEFATAVRRMFADAACQVNFARVERGYSTGPSHARLVHLRGLAHCPYCHTNHPHDIPCPRCGYGHARTPHEARARAAESWAQVMGEVAA
jgi:hypothetical protein